MQDHKKLFIWQRAIELTSQIYKITKKFPKQETYGIVNQMQRSSTSIASNIAEGAGKLSPKEFLQFIHTAISSSKELDTQIIISKNQDYITEPEYEKLTAQIDFLIRQLIKFSKHLQQKPK
jgi:four helix bundle protein